MADQDKKESLEEKLAKLEALTQKLEAGEMSIDESIAAYTEGMELAVECRKSLDAMTQKITQAKIRASQALGGPQEENSVF